MSICDSRVRKNLPRFFSPSSFIQLHMHSRHDARCTKVYFLEAAAAAAELAAFLPLMEQRTSNVTNCYLFVC